MSKNKFYELQGLAIPLALGSLAANSMGFIDATMAGNVSAVDLAAVSLAGSLWFSIMMLCYGVFIPLSPVISGLNKSNQRNQIAPKIHNSIYVSILNAIPIVILYLNIESILIAANVEREVASKTAEYLFYMIFAIPAYLCWGILKILCDSLSLTKIGMIVGYIGVIINVPLNYAFVNGEFGLPAMGGAGCGLATAILYWAISMIIALYIMTSKKFKDINVFKVTPPNIEGMKFAFNLGMPISIALFLDLLAFGVISILAAGYGAVSLAAHQVALNSAMLICMVPMALGNATSILVGGCVGVDDFAGAKESIKVGLVTTLLLIIVTSGLTVIFREHIGLIYSNDSTVLKTSSFLLILGALYQLFSALNHALRGALQGFGETKVIMKTSILSSWLVGLPLGYVLANTNLIVDAMGIYGLWVGLLSIPLVASSMMVLKLRHKLAGYDSQLQFES
ncbi:MATE family efflux transporter [Vibrio sinensis]|uniref:Multidrug resistance protein NorM n=1 Tax=Vibrio sinensis TaxID=2302434 RepID=A0A3A6R306_9VIBR|nr:MATE family efflux transporter [Vibrio sinensis]RJX70994.1 MATE family efflux transporter [Vibrio sinensis]